MSEDENGADVSSGPSPGPGSSAPALIAGIGASAGGLEAFRAFFSAMPSDSGMAFVVVQYLDPTHASALPEILRGSTRMAVTHAGDGDLVAPDHIYVIPPNATLAIKAGVLRLDLPASTAARRASVDIFLASLAEDQGERAVGIILSGFGSDGTLGIEAIKDQGGLTLAQAEFDHDAKAGMPRSAEFGGAVDHVLPVLDRYFSQENEQSRVSRDIREMCLFSVHDLVKDPPFSRLDLISCRNLLIYFDADLQKRVARRFHYGLADGGLLFLGTSEVVTAHAQLFTAEDKQQRIFSRREAPTQLLDIAQGDMTVQARIRTPADEQVGPGDSRLARFFARYTPAFAIIDRRQNVFQLSGPIGKYLAPSSGAISLNLSVLLHPDLRGPLRAALKALGPTRRTIRQEGVTVDFDGHREAVNIDAELLDSPDPLTAGQIIVAFQDLVAVGAAVASTGRSSDNSSPPVDELILARERLQALTEQLEASNEELQSPNEEYQSVNEELQSANEELETSKEELQSVNEELTTLNAELSNRNESLADLNADLVNLIDSTSIATLFLDQNLRIKRFTPPLLAIFPMRAGTFEPEGLRCVMEVPWTDEFIRTDLPV